MKHTASHPRLGLLLAAAIAVTGTITLAGCTAATTAVSATAAHHAQPPITPRLEGADNFRDLGGIGAGYATVEGGHVTRGVVYRSNALTLSTRDLDHLATLDITEVIDLRTPEEIAAKPDSSIPGATWVNENVLGSLGTSTAPSFTTPADAETMMTGAYTTMVTDPAARDALAETLTRIAQADGAVIVHCTAGKDRTGWVSALLLHIAGVDDALIDNNYLLTNQYSRATISSTLAVIRSTNGESAAAAYAPLLGVQRSFLDASRSAAIAEYGSIDGYLQDGLGLSRTTLDILRGKLTA